MITSRFSVPVNSCFTELQGVLKCVNVAVRWSAVCFTELQGVHKCVNVAVRWSAVKDEWVQSCLSTWTRPGTLAVLWCHLINVIMLRLCSHVTPSHIECFRSLLTLNVFDNMRHRISDIQKWPVPKFSSYILTISFIYAKLSPKQAAVL